MIGSSSSLLIPHNLFARLKLVIVDLLRRYISFWYLTTLLLDLSNLLLRQFLLLILDAPLKFLISLLFAQLLGLLTRFGFLHLLLDLFLIPQLCLLLGRVNLIVPLGDIRSDSDP